MSYRYKVAGEMPEEVLDLSRSASSSSSSSISFSVANKRSGAPGKGSKRPIECVDTSRPKRKQTSYSEETKRRVVYEVIVNHQSKAAMSRECLVPESTIRGWVKSVKTYLEAAKTEGRTVVLTLDGFKENDVLLDVKITSLAFPGTESPSRFFNSSAASPSRFFGSPASPLSYSTTPSPIRLPESAWYSRIDNSDAASTSTIPSPKSSPEYTVSGSPTTADAAAAPVDLTPAGSTTSSLDGIKEEPVVNRKYIVTTFF